MNTLPPFPYLGLRRFEAADGDLFRGREGDIELCVNGLCNSAVRVLVLQGLSGSGKSSFLRAGLLPALKKQFEEDGGSSGIVPLCMVVNAGPDMVPNLAAQMYDFVIHGLGAGIWPKQAQVLRERYPAQDDFVTQSKKGCSALIEFIAELSNNPRYAALIAIDQVEEFWTDRSRGSEGDEMREHFLRLVYEFALERMNGKLVLSIRTEQYGVFASTLPDSAKPAFAALRGVNKLFHHYLADPSREELIDLVRAPAAAYAFEFEEGVAEYIVDRLRAASNDPEMCVLPVLQTVLLRLFLGVQARSSDQGTPILISRRAFQTLHDEAEGNCTGIIADFVRWGLGQAVASVLQFEESAQARRMEVSCWQEVLRAMSSRSVSGQRGRDLKSMLEVESLAREANCKAHPGRMIHALTGPRIGLLSPPNGQGQVALRHDLICLALDQVAAIVTPGFWLQADRNQRIRIDRAAKYREDDLYVNEDRPRRLKIKLAELRFWDHKTLAYANHLGLFERMNMSVELVAWDEDISATELLALLACDSDTHAVFSYPRGLMTPAEQLLSRDMVVLNSFTGYAIICNGRAAEVLPQFDQEAGWDSFDQICTALLQLHAGGCCFSPEDEGAKDFLGHFLAIERFRAGADVAVAVDKVWADTKTSTLAGKRFVDELLSLEAEPVVAIVTAPTWALAMVDERSLRPVIDQRALLGLLDSGEEDMASELDSLRRKLEVRNVMNLRPALNAPSEEELRATMMRLTSIGLFIADCIWAQDVEAGEWIRKRWSETAAKGYGAQISPAVFRSTFRRSCGFVTADEHAHRYFGSPWNDNCPTALDLHHELLGARMKYEKQLAALATFQRAPGSGFSTSVSSLILRARNHADINNYHDAQRLIGQAWQQMSDAVESS